MSKEIEILAWLNPKTIYKYFNGDGYIQFSDVPEIQSNLYLKKLEVTEAFLNSLIPNVRHKLEPWLGQKASIRLRVARIADNPPEYFFIAKSSVNGQDREEMTLEISFNEFRHINEMFEVKDLYATRWKRQRYLRKKETTPSTYHIHIFHIYLNYNSAYGWTMEYELNGSKVDLEDEEVVTILLQTIRNEIEQQGQVELTKTLLDEMYNLVCLDNGNYFKRFPFLDFNTDGTYEKLFKGLKK